MVLPDVPGVLTTQSVIALKTAGNPFVYTSCCCRFDKMHSSRTEFFFRCSHCYSRLTVIRPAEEHPFADVLAKTLHARQEDNLFAPYNLIRSAADYCRSYSGWKAYHYPPGSDAACWIDLCEILFTGACRVGLNNLDNNRSFNACLGISLGEIELTFNARGKCVAGYSRHNIHEHSRTISVGLDRHLHRFVFCRKITVGSRHYKVWFTNKGSGCLVRGNKVIMIHGEAERMLHEICNPNDDISKRNQHIARLGLADWLNERI